MSNLKILCLPPVANTLRDLDMRFTWVVRHLILIWLVAIRKFKMSLKLLGIWYVDVRGHGLVLPGVVLCGLVAMANCQTIAFFPV